MLNMNVISMISSVISDIEWLAKYNFAGITVFENNTAWIHSPVFGNVELRLYYGTKIGPEMVGKNPYYEEVINLPESVYKRLMALCKDLAGMVRPYISGITEEDEYEDEDEPSPVRVKSGITADDDTPSSVGLAHGITEDDEEEEVGLDIEDVVDPYDVVGVDNKYVRPYFLAQSTELARLLRKFYREVMDEVLPVVKTEEEYEEAVKTLWREDYAHEYYRFVR